MNIKNSHMLVQFVEAKERYHVDFILMENILLLLVPLLRFVKAVMAQELYGVKKRGVTMSYFKKFEDWNTKYNHLSVDVEAYTIIKDLLISADEDKICYNKEKAQLKTELKDLHTAVRNVFLLAELDEAVITNLKAIIWVLGIGLVSFIGLYIYFIIRTVIG